MNISSVIIRADSEKLGDAGWARLLGEIGALEFVSVELDDESKGVIVAAIQAPDTRADIAALNAINGVAGVLSADMHLTYDDEEFSESKLQNIDDIAQMIDSTPIEDMKYGGDVDNYLK